MLNHTSIFVTNGDLIDNKEIKSISNQTIDEVSEALEYSYNPVNNIRYISYEKPPEYSEEETCTDGCNVNFKDCEELKPLPLQDAPLLRKNHLSEYKSELDRKIVLSNLGITFDNDKIENLFEKVENNSKKLSTIEEYANKNVQSDWNEIDETSNSFILNKPNLKNRVVLPRPSYEIGDVMPLMSWNAYEDLLYEHKFINQNKYHFLIAVSSNKDYDIYDMMLLFSGQSSISKIKQFFYNKHFGASIPLVMYIYHPTGSVSYDSRVIICYKSQISSSEEGVFAFIPLSLDMPGFKWENPFNKINTNDTNYILLNSRFDLSFPNAPFKLRVNGGLKDKETLAHYIITGAGRDVNLKTDETLNIECENTGNISMDWEFQVKKVPNLLSINGKPFDGSKELEIEVADTPLTTQEILSILI